MRSAYRVAVSEEDRSKADLVVQIVGLRFGLPATAIRADGRLSRAALRARRVAMYLAYVSFEWPQERVAHAFEVNRQTAAVACVRIEDARDSPELNTLLNELEGAIHAIMGRPGDGPPGVPVAA